MCEVHRIALRVSPSLGDDRKISPFCGRRLRYFPSVWGLSVTRRKPEDSCGAFPQRLGIDGAQPHHWTVWRISPVSGDDRIDSAISHPSGKYFPSVWGWSACSPAAAVPKNVFPQRLGMVGGFYDQVVKVGSISPASGDCRPMVLRSPAIKAISPAFGDSRLLLAIA